MSDSEMIDWLEEFVNENGYILIHDGKSNLGGLIGLGLRPGFLNRTLREAITQSAGRKDGRENPVQYHTNQSQA